MIRLYLANHLTKLMPATRCYKTKAFMYRWCGLDIHQSCRIASSAVLYTKCLTVSADTFIGHEAMIVGGNARIDIGCNVDIAPRVLIVSGTHEIGTQYRRAGSGKSLPIEIRSGTWVGAGTTILGGVTIGRGCIIGAGSVVNRDLPDNVLAVGVPARIVRELRDESALLPIGTDQYGTQS